MRTYKTHLRVRFNLQNVLFMNFLMTFISIDEAREKQGNTPYKGLSMSYKTLNFGVLKMEFQVPNCTNVYQRTKVQ